jgi:hypothetical protein
MSGAVISEEPGVYSHDSEQVDTVPAQCFGRRHGERDLMGASKLRWTARRNSAGGHQAVHIQSQRGFTMLGRSGDSRTSAAYDYDAKGRDDAIAAVY